MPIGGTHTLYILSLFVLFNVLPRTYAAAHPDSSLSKAIHYIVG